MVEEEDEEVEKGKRGGGGRRVGRQGEDEENDKEEEEEQEDAEAAAAPHLIACCFSQTFSFSFRANQEVFRRSGRFCSGLVGPPVTRETTEPHPDLNLDVVLDLMVLRYIHLLLEDSTQPGEKKEKKEIEDKEVKERKEKEQEEERADGFHSSTDQVSVAAPSLRCFDNLLTVVSVFKVLLQPQG